VSLAYTQRFMLFFGGTGAITYTVPAGHRIVVRSMTVFNGGATGTNAALWIQGQVVAGLTPGSNRGAELALYAVAYAGEALGVTYDSAAHSGQVTGYIFQDPTGPIGRAQLADAPALLPELERRQGDV